MFILEKVDLQSSEVKARWYLIKPGDYSVGRRDSDILLVEDKSISRNHATITIKVDSATKNKIFLIKDQSQFGTFVDGDRLEKDVHQKVYADSTIVFGAGPTVLKLKYAKMMFCLSGFPPQDKIVIMEKIRDLGCFTTESVDEASHVVQKQVALSITSKVLLSIILGRPIVKDTYIQALVERSSIAAELPPVESHAPTAKEVVSTEYSPKRRDLFAGVTFVFLNPLQCEKTCEIIVKAGGSYVCPLEKVPNNSMQPGAALSITETEEVMFGGDRKKALWVDPTPERTQLVPSSQKSLDTFWARVTKEKFRVVDVANIGESILAINKSLMGPFFQPDKTSRKSQLDLTQDLDATADESVSSKATASPATKRASSKVAAAPVTSPAKRTKPVPEPTVAVEGEDEEEERPARQPPKRKRTASEDNEDSSFSASTGGLGGENFKAFKKQKTQEASQREIVKVAKVVADAQSAIQEVFSRETDENKEGEALFNNVVKPAKKKR